MLTRWDMAKYPIKQSLKNLSEIISKQVGHLLHSPSGINNVVSLKVSQIEGDLKSKSNAYNALKSSLQVGWSCVLLPGCISWITICLNVFMNSEYREEADREPGDQKRCRSCQVGKFDFKKLCSFKTDVFRPPSFAGLSSYYQEGALCDGLWIPGHTARRCSPCSATWLEQQGGLMIICNLLMLWSH